MPQTVVRTNYAIVPHKVIKQNAIIKQGQVARSPVKSMLSSVLVPNTTVK